MRIAHLGFTVAPGKVEQALAALLGAAPSVRAMPGCRAFIPFANPSAEGGLGVIHEWDTAADFSAYLASPHFASLNAGLRPLMTGAPESRRFEAEPVCDEACRAG